MTLTERERFMHTALELAREAALAGDVPVGCVIVRDGTVIASGRNRKEERGNPLLHAEMVAIAEACAALGGWRLSDCTLYVTLEPCPMCAGAILNARVGTVVYGASDPAFGACGGVMNLFEEAFGHRPHLYGGVLGDTCAAVLRDFFDGLRKAEQPPEL